MSLHYILDRLIDAFMLWWGDPVERLLRLAESSAWISRKDPKKCKVDGSSGIYWVAWFGSVVVGCTFRRVITKWSVRLKRRVMGWLEEKVGRERDGVGARLSGRNERYSDRHWVCSTCLAKRVVLVNGIPWDSGLSVCDGKSRLVKIKHCYF